MVRTRYKVNRTDVELDMRTVLEVSESLIELGIARMLSTKTPAIAKIAERQNLESIVETESVTKLRRESRGTRAAAVEDA